MSTINAKLTSEANILDAISFKYLLVISRLSSLAIKPKNEVLIQFVALPYHSFRQLVSSRRQGSSSL
jgi:hypothetical protein